MLRFTTKSRSLFRISQLLKMGGIQVTPKFERTFRRPTVKTESNSPISIVSNEFYRRELPRHCIALSSSQGKLLFREALLAGSMEVYFPLSAQLCTQDEPAYCGLTTLVMILNAFEMDPGRVWKGPWRWYHETMITCCLPPNIITDGIVLDKFAEIARCHGLSVDLHHIHPDDKLSTFRDLVIKMTASDELGFLVVCFHRSALKQTGAGHFAAIGGYHAERDLVFLFETARFKYSSHWAPLSLLWEGMCMVDSATQQTRGYMIIKRASFEPNLSQTANESDASCTENLRLFSISDSARQAYLSPATLCYKNSVGFRLRRVMDDWINWLSEKPDSLSDSSVIFLEAARMLLNACIKHQPGNFFLTLQPFAATVTDQVEMDDYKSTHQYQIMHDLATSLVGQAINLAVLSLSNESYAWLTKNGTFHLAITRVHTSMSTTDHLVSSGPFSDLYDDKLRLCVLLTCFLCAFPYTLMLSSYTNTTDVAQTRLNVLHERVHSITLLDNTQMELRIVQTILWSLLSHNSIKTCCNECLARHR